MTTAEAILTELTVSGFLAKIIIRDPTLHHAAIAAISSHLESGTEVVYELQLPDQTIQLTDYQQAYDLYGKSIKEHPECSCVLSQVTTTDGTFDLKQLVEYVAHPIKEDS